MIDCLNRCGISSKTVEELYKKYEDSVLNNISCNEEECVKIIEILRRIGIESNIIEQLLISRIDLFFITCNEFVEKVKKVGMTNFVQMINQDWLNIETIFED